MRITEATKEPIGTLPFLNAGRRPNQFFQDEVPIFHFRVDQLPDAVEAMVVTADLQGRELLPRQGGRENGLRLLGEIAPQMLWPFLESIGIHFGGDVAAILAGDFYTYPDLRGRGGTGDVTEVWQSFADEYRWVVGVAGNHDQFVSNQPFSRTNAHFLDGHRKEVDGLRFAGLSGVIGNPKKNYRRRQDEFLFTLEEILSQPTDILVMHDGPSVPSLRLRGIDEALEVVRRMPPKLVIRGHSHWPTPFVELEDGTQILNVDQTIAILTE